MKASQIPGAFIFAATLVVLAPLTAAQSNLTVTTGPSQTITLAPNTTTGSSGSVQTGSVATTSAHLDAIQRNMTTALDALSHATTNNKGGYVEKSIADIHTAMTDLAQGIQFAKATPGVDGLPLPATNMTQPILAQINGAQGTRLSVAPNLFRALDAFTLALKELDATPGGDLGGNRAKLLADIALSTTDVISGINVAATGSPTSSPTGMTFTSGTLSYTGPSGPSSPIVPVEWNADQQMNNFFVTRFLGSDGLSASRISAAPMAYNDSMLLVLDGGKANPASVYKIDSLELIGIAMHPHPVAYVVRQHQAPPSQPTRELTDFEKQALVNFSRGREVSADYDSMGGRIIVGAVRAQASCVSCHPGAKVGDVLGAFSYRLSLTALRQAKVDASSSVTH